MQVAAATAAGSEETPNEDAVFSSPNSIVVLDGLSAPSDLPHACLHGTPWFVHRLGATMTGLLGDPATSMREALRASINAVNDLHPECISDLNAVPASTVVSVRITSDQLEYLVLSDSVLILDDDGEISTVSDARVSELATEEVDATLSTPAGSRERKAALSRLVKVQRKLRNAPDGYWVAAASPEAADHAVTGAVSLGRFRRAALLTDGASRLVDLFGVYGWEQLLDSLEAAGPAALITQTRATEATDPDGVRWPRYKGSDDAAVAYLTHDQVGP